MEISNSYDICIIRLDSIEEIKAYFQGLISSKKYLWYRGVSHASYRLLPKAYDVGDKLGFLKATVEYALRRPDLGDPFRNYLHTLF